MIDAAPRPAYQRKLFWVALLYFSEGLPLTSFRSTSASRA